jgi:xylulokinase
LKEDLLMGIDLGTSSAKVILINPKGELCSSSSHPYPILSPKPGWAEQNPADWLEAVQIATLETIQKAGCSRDAIRGISFSGQMHGMVCLDKAKELIRPAIIWADQRSQKQVEAVQERVGAKHLGEWTANPLAVGFMLPSLLWLRENEPENFGKTRCILLPKDYLRLCLTGELGSEPSDASSTAFFNTVQRHWSSEMMGALEIDKDLFPPIHESIEIAGCLLPGFAKQAGLKPGIPVIFGGADQACQALGNGIIRSGNISCTIGTGGQILAPINTPRYDPQLRLHCFCHLDPSLWYLMTATLAAGLSLRWLKDTLFKGMSFSELADSASVAQAGSGGLIFLPYLGGERTPLMDPKARGGFIGITLRHKQEHFIRAVMEGVVYSLRQGLEILLEQGVQVEKFIASGGGAHHPLWLQLLADIFNMDVYRSLSEESSAVGAAMLGGIGAGIYRDVWEAANMISERKNEVFYPNPEDSKIYEEGYQIFKGLFPSLRDTEYEETWF